MTEFRHDPNSLAVRLDQLLPPGQPEQIGVDGDPLVETAARIASAPRPSLSPDAMARIQARVTQARPMPQPRLLRIPSSGRLALVAVITVMVIAGTVFAAHEIGITLIVPPTASSTPTHTATASPTLTSSFTPSATASATPTPTASATVTTTPSPSATGTATYTETSLPPTSTPTSTPLPVTVVVEGPVQAISGNIVTVYDTEIEVNLSDVGLPVIHVGDFVRVEGDLSTEGSVIVVIAVRITVETGDLNVGPDGEIWRDTGDCSNPPPPWAPAHGWRARCEGAPPPGNSGGTGMGNGDDDDD
jgi:hypothetical protein